MHSEIIVLKILRRAFTPYIIFNGNRYRYHCGLITNLLQPSGYCTCHRGQKLACVFLVYFISVFRMLLSINSKYSPIQYSLIVFLMEEHCILCEEHKFSIIAHRHQQLQCTVILHPPHPLMVTVLNSATKDAFCRKWIFVCNVHLRRMLVLKVLQPAQCLLLCRVSQNRIISL